MALRAKTRFSLADQLFNAETVAVLANAMAGAHAGFDAGRFRRSALDGFPDRELKARIVWMVELLAEQLPDDVPTALDILQAALPPQLDPSLTDDDFGHFIWAVPAEYCARFACEQRHLTRALAFLRECTMRFSVENAIRPFLVNFTRTTMVFIRRCATDPDYHVRRLASEGIRPLLPWAPRVPLTTDDIIPVLDLLHADPTRYVTRSVANTLNDLSRSDADAVFDALDRWKADGRQRRGELEWMTRHALRTLRRNADPRALRRLGYPTHPRITVRDEPPAAQVMVGDMFEWRFTLRSNARQKLAVQLRMHYLKANGSHSVRVFKVRDASFSRGEEVSLTARQPMRPMTTRTLYPGAHRAELEVNGRIVARTEFVLGER